MLKSNSLPAKSYLACCELFIVSLLRLPVTSYIFPFTYLTSRACRKCSRDQCVFSKIAGLEFKNAIKYSGLQFRIREFKNQSFNGKIVISNCIYFACIVFSLKLHLQTHEHMLPMQATPANKDHSKVTDK